MKNNFLYFLLFISFFSNIFTQNDNYENMWLSFPACHMGRLQSPVRLNISESKYSNSFSIVYQYFIYKFTKKWCNKTIFFLSCRNVSWFT